MRNQIITGSRIDDDYLKSILPDESNDQNKLVNIFATR
jgi:hypothetical protein